MVTIRPCADPARRARLEADVHAWLRWYFDDLFTDPFCEHHVEMIRSILNAARHGGDQAIAAPRGEGKTTIAECLIVYCVLTGVLSFPVLFAATAADAERSLSTIKEHLEDNERLHADYREVCDPIVALESTPNRAHTMVAQASGPGGFEETHIRFQWAGNKITLPRVPGSRCARAIIATRGLDGAVRGLKVGARRPDLAVLDDPDTEESAASEIQGEKLSRRIDRAIAGLAPKGRRLARVLLTTLQNRRCVSATYTDPQKKPSWHGKRFAFLLHFPERIDLWDEYASLRQADQQAGDEFARRAHAFYLKRREEMDALAAVVNPNSFDGRLLPDGSQLQVSAIQRYYDFVADNGLEAALSELQNDPPEEDGPIEVRLSANRIQRQVNGLARKAIPAGAILLTQGIDVRKVALHYSVRAWSPDGTVHVIDYGVQEVLGTRAGSDEGVDTAILRAIRARVDAFRSEPYAFVDGQTKPVELTLIDAGWKTEAVYQACRELGPGVMPAMGFGKSAGCTQARFTAPVHSSPDRKPGDGWFLSRRPGGVWLVAIDSDRWKSWEHDRWLTPRDKPGAISLFGEPNEDESDRMSVDQKHHFSFAKHITAEAHEPMLIKGRLVYVWKSHSDNNHYLDASVMATVAAGMLGVKLVVGNLPARKTASSQRSPARPPADSGTPDGRAFLASER